MAGDDVRINALLGQRTTYLRDPRRLADVGYAERVVHELSCDDLAAMAGVDVDVVRRMERALPLRAPGDVRRVLRSIGIEPRALPDMAIT